MDFTRRSFLQGLAAAGVGLQFGCSRSHPATPGATPNARALHDLPPVDPLVQVLRRSRFGISQTDYDEALSLGIDAYLDQQLTTPGLPDPVELQAEALYPTTALPAGVLLLSPESTIPTVQQQLRERTLYLAIYSPRQLYEVLVDFWTNHFNVAGQVDQLAGYKVVDDREVVRANALGRFRDMLHASAKSPAMIVYLNNLQNTKDGPNENYARELMELHTLGVDGGYTEQDVKEVARCFTGWTINAGTKLFQFDAATHDTEEKVVLGHVIPAGGGVEDGEQVLDLLAEHPSTARFLATKLVRRFVSDNPPQPMVDRIAQVFSSSDGDIPALVRAIFSDADFHAHADEKMQRPVEFVASAIRALAPDTSLSGYYGPVAIDAVTRMGHVPHGWVPPNGFPDTAEYWLSTTGLLERWNFAAALAEARNGNQSHVQAIVGDSQSAQGLVDVLSDALVRRPLWPQDRDALARFAGDGDTSRVLEGAELQDRAEAIAGLLLASPYFILR